MDEFIIGVIVFSLIVILTMSGFVKWFDTLDKRRALQEGGSINNKNKLLFLVYLFVGIIVVGYITNKIL